MLSTTNSLEPTNWNLRLYNAPDLREHCLNAVSVETPRGIRLAKEKQSAKIDGAVALSFAVLAAVQHGNPPSLSDKDSSGTILPDKNWDPRAANQVSEKCISSIGNLRAGAKAFAAEFVIPGHEVLTFCAMPSVDSRHILGKCSI